MGILLSTVPLPYRILGILALCAALFGYGYLEGMDSQKEEDAKVAAQQLAESVMAANARAKAESAAQFEAASLRAQLKAKNAASLDQVKKLQAVNDKYKTCAIDKAVADELEAE